MQTFKMTIIDDEPNFSVSLANIIENAKLNIQVTKTFKNGIKALEFMNENNVDIVLTDIKMPGMDGIEFVKECSAYFPDTIIIFMSAYSEFDAAKFAIQNNVKGYLLKPIEYNELIDLLTKITNEIKKKNEPENDTFNSLLFSYQQIFSQIFYGTILQENELLQQWQTSGLDVKNISKKHAVVRITLEGFSDYLENVWIHEYYRFFDAVNSIMQFCCKNINFRIIKYCFDTLDLIAYCEEAELEEILEDSIVNISNTLTKELKIKNTAEILGIFDNVYQMIGFKPGMTKHSDLKNNDMINSAIDYMKQNYFEDITLTDVATHVFLSPAYFSVLFKQKTNENFTTMMNKIRIDAAKKMLTEENIKPSSVYLKVGFKSYTYFFKRFKSVCNMTPNEYKKKYGLYNGAED